MTAMNLCACGCAARSRRPKIQVVPAADLAKAVRDVVGEMCPNPAPATAKSAGKGAFRFLSCEERLGYTAHAGSHGKDATR
jgi:hypothetical protein